MRENLNRIDPGRLVDIDKARIDHREESPHADNEKEQRFPALNSGKRTERVSSDITWDGSRKS